MNTGGPILSGISNISEQIVVLSLTECCQVGRDICLEDLNDDLTFPEISCVEPSGASAHFE